MIHALTRTRDERGAAALELVVVIPGLVLLLGMMIAGGRLWFAHTTVTEAAQVAARAASIARSASQATTDGRSAGEQSMSTGGLHCSDRSIVVHTAAFSTAVGTPATIRTQLTCRVPLADLLLPGTPGSILITGDGSAALDTYRARS
jgi:Flp pilus assembly protein TadG